MTINNAQTGARLAVINRVAPVFLAGMLAGCVGDNDSSNPDFDVAGLLDDTTDIVILPGYQALATQTTLLSADDGALAQYCTAIGTATEAARKAEAQQAWRTAMNQWQSLEMHRLGPIADNGDALGNRVSSFGSSNLSDCGVDQAVVLSRQDGFDLATRSSNQRGLEAIEYTLFNDNLDHTCSSQITRLSDWNERPDVERTQWRCDYARLVASDVADAASTIYEQWRIDGENYRSEFLNPAVAGTTLETLSDAVFYLDVVVKDLKLGVPLGISDDCSAFSCPEQIESPYSEHSLTNIRNNLVGFTRLIEHDGLSFGDLIRHAGVPDVATRLTDNANAAIELIDGMDSSLLVQATAIDSSDRDSQCTNAFTNPEADSELTACRLYGLIKRITDDLKVGFVAAVNVDLPDRAQSDND